MPVKSIAFRCRHLFARNPARRPDIPQGADLVPPTRNSSRDLLCGLLALQTGLINQSQLVAAFRAWTQHRDRTMAEILAEQGALETPCLTIVEGLVIEHLRRHGSDPDRSLAAIGVVRSTCEYLARIGDGELDASLAKVGSGSTEPDADRTASYSVDRTAGYSVGSVTGNGQRFRVLRPHAQGGLGAVFVALDTELHREVALKQILDSHADDESSRHRFLLEAEITGGLEHPGIVPVYGLGTYADGRPYYAMRFVRGDSLKEVANRFHADGSSEADPGRRSLDLRQLLRRFTDVCNAIEYAHSRGVLHRDIKPGNIIAGKHGQTLVVDWGLAKATGRVDHGMDSDERTLVPSSVGGSAETSPGSALGTPAYMSPEQAEGDLEHLGPRSDIYSLGATLYYVLTGRPPVEGDVHEAIRAVQRGEFRHPRQLDATIDRALEAVCLRAMAHRPADRYASPKALSEDVERWMADEPVSAWREPLSRRARRWAKRNRTAVTSAAVALIAGVVGLSAILVLQTRAKAAIAEGLVRETNTNKALAAANVDLAHSNAAVQARYDLAVEAISTFHTGVSEDFLLTQDQFQELRKRLLRSAAGFYGKLSALLGQETDIASRRALAQSNFELAELTAKVGRQEEALAVHRAVLTAREALADGPGADPGAKADFGRSLNAVATLLVLTGKTGEALAIFHRSELLLTGLASTDPSARAALAACRSQIGIVLWRMGRLADALTTLRQARADLEVLTAAPGATDEARFDLAKTIARIGNVLAMAGTLAEAESELRRAMALQQALADDHPDVIQFRRTLGQSRHGLGWMLQEMRRSAEAGAEYGRAVALRQALADNYPAVTAFRMELADSHYNLGWLLQDLGKSAEAEAEYRQAVEIQEKLADDQPDVHQYQISFAMSLARIGTLRARGGRASEGADLFRRAIAVMQRPPTLRPDDLYNLACNRSLLAGMAGVPDSGVSADVGKAEADRAMEALRKAVNGGYRDLAHMRTDADLDPLRDRDDFRLLLMDLALPDNPFARGD
jgi:eukaryotic-like serine/threonine-protein kinase